MFTGSTFKMFAPDRLGQVIEAAGVDNTVFGTDLGWMNNPAQLTGCARSSACCWKLAAATMTCARRLPPSAPTLWGFGMTHATLSARICAGDVVIGTFVKSPSVQVAEVMGLSGLDFVVIDQGHALIRTDATDLLVLAGEMVPHVVSAGQARTVCSAVKFAHGAGGALRSFRRQQRHHGTNRGCPALGRPDEIAACADIDVLFVSPADLSQPKGRRTLSRAG